MTVVTAAYRNEQVTRYIPMSNRIASAFWQAHAGGKSSRHGAGYEERRGHTQGRNTEILTYDDVQSAGHMALIQARDNWDPLLPTCGVEKCRLETPEGQCQHGNSGYTFGAYARRYVEGACIAALKSTYRRPAIPYVTELMPLPRRCIGDTDVSTREDDQPYNYLRLPAHDRLADGSEYDGAPGGLAPGDVRKIVRRVLAMIADGTCTCNGMSTEEMLAAVQALSTGAPATPATQAVAAHLRVLLAEYRESADDTPERPAWSLFELAQEITRRYPHDPGSKKRLGEWLGRGWIPGRQGADGRWEISHWGAMIAIRRWGDRPERKPLDTAPALSSTLASKRSTATMSTPARILTVEGHGGTVLPEHGNGKVVIVQIEVGQGRAPSYGVSHGGDRFVGANRQAVLDRFGLVHCADDVIRPAGTTAPLKQERKRP
jgi:hypothetical protein